MCQGGFGWGRARQLFTVCLVLSGYGLNGPAWAQETDASIAQMFAKAQHAQEVTLYPIQYRSEVEISGSSEIVVAGSCLQRRANSAGVVQSSDE